VCVLKCTWLSPCCTYNARIVLTVGGGVCENKTHTFTARVLNKVYMLIDIVLAH